MFFIFFLFPTWSLFYSGADLHQRQLALQLWRHLKLTQTYTEFCDLWFLCGQFGSPNAFLSVKIENKGIRKIKPIQPERLFAVVRNFIYPFYNVSLVSTPSCFIRQFGTAYMFHLLWSAGTSCWLFYNFKGYQVREGKPVGKWSHCVQFLATERICSLLSSQIIPIHLSAFSMNVAAGFSMFFTGALNLSKTTF